MEAGGRCPAGSLESGLKDSALEKSGLRMSKKFKKKNLDDIFYTWRLPDRVRQ